MARSTFLCWPRFDSPTIFASLLDDERGGCFELIPVLDDPRHRQLYLPDTNVLLTRFLSPDGVAEISDFMTIEDLDAGSRLVRRVKAVRGSIHFRMRCMPRLDYARLTRRSARRRVKSSSWAATTWPYAFARACRWMSATAQQWQNSTWLPGSPPPSSWRTHHAARTVSRPTRGM